jgi:CHAT domain-containing protein
VRIGLLISWLCFVSFVTYAQTFDDIWNNYKTALKFKNDAEIAKNGLLIIEEIQNEKIEFDSIVCEIRMYTALSLSAQGKFDQSLQLNFETEQLINENWGKENEIYASILSNISMDYSDIGDNSEALEYSLEALNIYEKTPIERNSNYATILNNIALHYSSLGKYLKALEYNLRALNINENSKGKEPSNYGISLMNIAANYFDMGDYSKALDYNLKALNFLNKTQWKGHPDIALCLINIAWIYSAKGNFSIALEYSIEALNLYEEYYRKEHPDIANCLIGIASIYSKFRDHSKALEYDLQALYINEQYFEKEHPVYASNLSHIATDYSNLGDYSKALEFNLRVLEFREKKFGKEHLECATILNNIALNYLYIGDYSKALEFNLNALDIFEKSLDKTHPDYAMSLNNIACNYSKMGDYSKALEYNLKVLDNTDTSLEKNHPYQALRIENIAIDYFHLGDYSSSSKYLFKSYLIKETSYLENKFGLDFELLLKYKENLNLSFLLNTSILVVDTTNVPFLNLAWMNLNGQIGSNAKQLEIKLAENNDNSIVQYLNVLKLSKKQLSIFNERSIQENEKSGIDQKALEEEINSMERELSKYSKEFADFNRYFYLSDVTNELNENEIFVDIARIPYYSFYSNKWTDSIKYLVFITDSKDTLVDYLFIDNGLELEKELISDYKLESSDKNAATDLKNEIFYNSFWKPIAEKIGDAKTVYVSLGGVYNNINLNTLYNPETGKYLLEENDIRIVNSARDFVLSKEREKKQYTSTTSALYGFPDFNGNATKTVDTTDFLSSTRDLDKMWIDSLTRGGMKASPLPATKVEVEQIAGTFQKNGWNVKTYTGETASETNIKLEESPRVLHVATHGYFFEDIPMDKTNDRFLGMDRQRVVQDPMLRSGLLFTGGNKTLQGEQVNGENGLLSAAEASLLDLRETELVVLSACETGKGEVKNSEGVYGLRKAFSDAGAQNIIMSLWKVDDKVTQEFMSRFYEIWLNDKTSIRKAFNRTQLEIKAKYPQPYYWGAFILVGE